MSEINNNAEILKQCRNFTLFTIENDANVFVIQKPLNALLCHVSVSTM